MALQGWRLCGVTVIIVIYIGGVLFLSMKNVPGSHPKRTRIERLAEVKNEGNIVCLLFRLFKLTVMFLMTVS